MKSYVALSLVIALTGMSSTSLGQEIGKKTCMRNILNNIRIGNVATNARTQMLNAASSNLGSTADGAVNRRR